MHCIARFDWVNITFILGYHLGLAIALPWYLLNYTPRLGTIISSVALLFLTGIGVTAGYHRYYSHRAYKASKPVELFLLFFGTMATQGSVLQCSWDHRKHHQYVDTDKDPYSINRGFLQAHMLWMFSKREKVTPQKVPDLAKDKLLFFQHKYYGILFLATNFLAFTMIGLAFNDLLGAFMISWWTRQLVSHHTTWFINSLAHTWGSKRYTKELSAVDNFIIALLTYGEGYHNYHHTFATDYRNGIRWYHFDPTKWFIWTMSKIRLARNLKKVKHPSIYKRLLNEDRKLMLDHLKKVVFVKRGHVENKIEEISGNISARVQEFYELKEQYKARKAKSIKLKLKKARKDLRYQWRSWNRLSGRVLRLRPDLV